MEENKNLVICYSYYVEKEVPGLAEVKRRIHELMQNQPTEEEVEELKKTMHKSYELERNNIVWVHKEYPEFLVKDFKTKEELFDFLDEDEPAIYRGLDVWLEKVPNCLKEIGIEEDTWKSRNECIDYIEAKHAKEGN